MLSTSHEWQHGPLHGVTATRIGAEYGFGGRVYRVEGETDEGASVSLIAKEEDRASVERALAFRKHNTTTMGAWIPRLYCSHFDDGGELGVLLMEDISPNIQGDVLSAAAQAQAERLIRTLARLHTSSLDAGSMERDEELPRWQARPMEHETWTERLSLTSERYPEILTTEISGRLANLPGTIDEAGAALGNGASCWIHADMHLDNVLFRPDDSAVILDWANARIGPPALDLAHLLTEGLDTGDAESRLGQWLPIYREEAARFGVGLDLGELRSSIGWAILPLLQGTIGWAGRAEEPAPRLMKVRENLLRNTCAWLETDVVPDVG